MARPSVYRPSENNALRQAINARNLNEAKLLIADGADVNHIVNPYLDTMLHKAIDVSIVHDLLECGANINAKNLYERTPLHSAVIEGKTEVLKTLLKNGPLVNLRDSKRFTPLHYAVKSRNVEAIKNLVMYNAVINFKRKCGLLLNNVPVLTVALFQDDLTSIKALIRYAVLVGNLQRERRGISREINLQPCYGMKNYHLARAYKYDCEDEIRRMKSEKLTDCLTLFRMISATYLHSFYKDAERMELFTERLIKVVIGDNYPLYRDFIIEQLRGKLQVPCLKNMLLLVQISSVSTDLNEKEPTTLNPNINYILAEYLSKNDLFNLILASSEPTTYEINPIKPNLKITLMNTSRPIIPIKPNLKTLMNIRVPIPPIIPNLKRTLMNTSRPSATIPFAKCMKLI